MILSAPFIRRPVATTLLTIAVALAGAVAFTVLPVSPLRRRFSYHCRCREHRAPARRSASSVAAPWSANSATSRVSPR
jgi:hypothetical protein